MLAHRIYTSKPSVLQKILMPSAVQQDSNRLLQEARQYPCFIMKENEIKILVIDDTIDVGNTLEKYFKKFGCEVLLATSGEEGMALARIHKFNVILLDIYMPEMRGDVVLSKLKQVFPKIPVIMITGYDDEDIAKACMEAGAYDFISKPFDYNYLRTSVFSTIS